MHPADNLLCANTFGYTGPSLVYQSHDVTPLSTRLTHNGHLSSCENKYYIYHEQPYFMVIWAFENPSKIM